METTGFLGEPPIPVFPFLSCLEYGHNGWSSCHHLSKLKISESPESKPHGMIQGASLT